MNVGTMHSNNSTIICIGNGNTTADNQASEVAQTNNLRYNGLLVPGTQIEPGCYHTSIYDIKLPQLMDMIPLDGTVSFVVLDQDLSDFKNKMDYYETEKIITVFKNRIQVDFINADRGNNWTNIDLEKNKSFCILPFIHLHVSETSDIKLCCNASGNPVKKYTQDFNFNSDSELQEVRESMLNGTRIPYCQKCYDIEDKGASSARNINSDEWLRKLNITTKQQVHPNLVYYDIRNDNLCNLSCRMCNPRSSSQLEKEYKSIGWYWGEQPKSVGFTDIVDLATARKIYVAGGEPSLMPEFKNFLKRAIDANRLDMEICLTTNATNLNKEYRELLAPFKNLTVVCSIDGYDRINQYIRWPADWQTIIKNVHKLLKITPHIAFTITVGIWNISNLSKLIKFLEVEFPNNTVMLNQVYGNTSWEFTTFPNKEVALNDLELIKQSSYYNTDYLFRSKLDYFIEEISKSTPNLVALTEFFKYNDTLDASRGIRLIDYIPELEKCRNLITKQT